MQVRPISQYNIKTKPVLHMMKKQQYKCAYCDVVWTKYAITSSGSVKFYSDTMNEKESATVDHAIPRSRGGSDRLINKLACCVGCNNLKADLFLNSKKEFIQYHLLEKIDDLLRIYYKFMSLPNIKARTNDVKQVALRLKRKFNKLYNFMQCHHISTPLPQEIIDLESWL